MAVAQRRAPLGQHFLQSPSILGRIARQAGALAGDSDLVVEIGAGPGTLTARLLDLGKPSWQSRLTRGWLQGSATSLAAIFVSRCWKRTS